MTTKSVLARISRARGRLVLCCPFFGSLALKLRVRLARPEDDVFTAAVTPDAGLILNSAFVARLTDAELGGVVAHEVLHLALLYFQRQGNRDSERWGVAHDHAVNHIILSLGDEWIELPTGSLIDPVFDGMCAEDIYSRLSTVQGADRGVLAGDCRDDLAETDDGRAATRDPAAARRLEDEWRLAVAAALQAHERARGVGSLPESLRILVDGVLAPKLDWRELLSRWVGEHGRRELRTYSRPSRRSESVGEYLPSLRPWGAEDLVVVLDVSGSVGTPQLVSSLAEIDGIATDLGTGVRVILADAAIQKDLVIADAVELIEELVGGGNSDFRPVFDKLASEGFSGVVVAITDGEIRVPDSQPVGLRGVLWALVSESNDPPTEKWGEWVRIPPHASGRTGR